MNGDTHHHAALGSSEYRHLLARFDHLWENATSADAQQEMQCLLARIEAYEMANGAHGNRS